MSPVAPEDAETRIDSGCFINTTAVLESTTDCVLVLDRAWHFAYLNERAKALIGPGRDLIGKNVWEAFPQPPASIFEGACRRAMSERFPERCEDFYAPLGIWFENSIYPCGDGIAVYFRDITEQKRQHQALHDSEELSRQQLAELESIYASAPVGLAVISPDLHVMRVNERMAEIDGCSVAAHIGAPIRDIVPELADVLEATAQRVLTMGEPVRNLEVEGVTPAQPGVRRAWIAQWYPQKDASGRIVSINIVVEDVTELKRAERALRDKAEELQAVLDAVPAAVFVAHDPDCRTITGNRTCLELLRLPDGANTSKSAGDDAPQNFRPMKNGMEIAPEDLPVQQAAATGMEVRGFEMELAFDRSPSMHIYGNARPLFDVAGRPRGAVGAFVDVTELVEARSALARRHEELEHQVAERTTDRDRLWQLSTDLMLVVGFDSVIVAVNPAWTTLLGWAEQELIGREFYKFLHPDDRGRTTDAARTVATGATIQGFSNRYRHKDGAYRWITWTAVPGDDLIHAVGRDVTAEKQKAEALELSVARMRAIFETSFQYQGLMTTDGILLDANQASLAGIEARLQDVVGKPFWETPWFTATPGMAEQVQAAIPLVAAGQTLRQEIVVNLPTGRRAFDFAMRPVCNDAGEVIAIVPEAVELTERRAAEEQLRQAQKMEAVGQLSGGLAHDFNNLLAGITGNLELLGARLAEGRINDLDRYIAMAQEAAKRAAVLTHRLMAFSRRQTLDPKPTNINRLVAGMAELIHRTVGPEITVDVIEAHGLWSTLIDQNQLESALLNLCINARDAMPDGGTLTIETSNRRLDDHEYVSLTVADTGYGMTQDVIARAFDPFFTTKPIGEGTGLGLSMVYGFVQQSGGQARIASEPGAGSRVQLYLPRHFGAEDSPEQPADRAALHRAGEGETVLVVDDDPTVRSSIIEALEVLGYAAIGAEDGAEGLQVLQSDQRIDLMITDMGLPRGMNGAQLADAGRMARPELKILFVSGYDETAMFRDGQLRPGMHVLTKPFPLEALASRIAAVIAER